MLRRGPLFCQVMLADEINRAPAKTQSALLEAMQENQVTIEGTTLPLPRPFMVLATQNPVEQEGVYRLPEAQLDRFLLRVEMGYPGRKGEVAMLRLHSHPVREVGQLFTADQILDIQDRVSQVHGEDGLLDYIVELAEASRTHPDVALGASPRASLCLLKCARARALLDGRHYFTHEDVQAVAGGVLGHRLIIRPEAEVEGKRPLEVSRRFDRNSTRCWPADDAVFGERSEASPAPRSPGTLEMLTSRAWWVLSINLLVLFFGLTIASPALTLVPLTLLFWFGGEWLLFAVRIPLAVRRLRLLREVYDERGPVVTLWAGRPFEVGLRLEAGGRMALPYVALDDRPPFDLEYLGGPLAADGRVGGDDGLEVRYNVRCRGPGLARFDGVRVHVADFQGFFTHTAFVSGVSVYRVLPVLAEGRDPTPTLKRDNQLPPPGVHRLRRPGSASASSSTSATTCPATRPRPSPGRCRPAATASSPRCSRARRPSAARCSWTPPTPCACRPSTARRWAGSSRSPPPSSRPTPTCAT